MTSNPELKSERSRLRRKHERGHYDKASIYPILDASPLCHISFVDQFGTPSILPTLHWREGDHIYWHASSAARSLKAMKNAPVALAVTLMDGFVMARSAMNHSMNYRSVVVFGEVFEVKAEEKEEKLKNMIENYFPTRWEKLRPITEIELKQTGVFGMDIREASAKIRNTGVIDDATDLNWPVWSGVIPISTSLGERIEDEHNNTNTPPGSDIEACKLSSTL